MLGALLPLGKVGLDLILMTLLENGMSAGGKYAAKKMGMTAAKAAMKEAALKTAAGRGLKTAADWGIKGYTLGGTARTAGHTLMAGGRNIAAFTLASEMTDPLFQMMEPGRTEASIEDYTLPEVQQSAFGNNQQMQLQGMDQRGIETNTLLELLGDTDFDRLVDKGLV